MNIAELEHAVGFNPETPCIFCEQPVERLSAGGPLVCPPCDCGRNKDGTPWSIPQAALRYANARRRMAETKS